MNKVPIAIPVAITNPMLTRLTAPAPEAKISGITPSTIEAVVIKIGRKRVVAADSIATINGRRPAGTSGISIVLGEGQTSPDIVISMTPTGAIAGRVLDRGRPVRNAWVRALKARYFDGERSLSVVEWAKTDDRGELPAVRPGAADLYVVSAIPLERSEP